jgi:hypothetical protein
VYQSWAVLWLAMPQANTDANPATISERCAMTLPSSRLRKTGTPAKEPRADKVAHRAKPRSTFGTLWRCGTTSAPNPPTASAVAMLPGGASAGGQTRHLMPSLRALRW